MSRRESFPARLALGEAHLRVMVTSDLHMALAPWDYLADAPGGPPGLAGIAPLVARFRATAGASLLVDCGDFLQGNPMADYYGLERGLAEGELHPMVAAMNALDYDAVTLGNHEFNYGLEFLRQAMAGARFEVVVSNLVAARGATPLQDLALWPKRRILDVSLHPAGGPAGVLRLGLIGLAPPQVVSWEQARLGGAVAARGMVEAARAHAAALRAEGAELVLALVHGGIGADAGHHGDDRVAEPLARLADIDVLALGHSHGVFPQVPEAFGAVVPTTLPTEVPAGAGHGGGAGEQAGIDPTNGRIHGRPAVMPGSRGSHLGLIDLVLARGADHSWRARAAQVQAVPVPQPQGPALCCPVRRASADAHAATRAHVARPAGHSAVPLHSHFAQITDSAALQLVAAAQRRWASAALAGTPHAALPLLSAVAPFRCGGPGGPGNYVDLPAGPLLLRDLHALYEYPNTLTVLRLTGAELAAWLERAASLYARLSPRCPDTPLLTPEAPAYNFDRVDGVTYRLDLGQPPRHAPDGRLLAPDATRVRDLAHDGRPVEPEAQFLLVTSNHRAAGGGGYPGASPENLVLEGRAPCRDALIAEIRARTRAPLFAPRPPAWRLSAPRGSTALFDTGPGATRHLAEISDFAPEATSLTPEGFLRLRLRF